ncbi:MAG: hypothetical protein KKI08_14405 [Armatimonadetes bacterium]|nr:hypothetical protein [Armatimonadota bacterium]
MKARKPTVESPSRSMTGEERCQWEALLAQYGPLIRRECSKARTENPDLDLEDIVQVVHIHLGYQLHHVLQAEKPEAYVRTVVHNRIRREIADALDRRSMIGEVATWGEDGTGDEREEPTDPPIQPPGWTEDAVRGTLGRLQEILLLLGDPVTARATEPPAPGRAQHGSGGGRGKRRPSAANAQDVAILAHDVLAALAQLPETRRVLAVLRWCMGVPQAILARLSEQTEHRVDGLLRKAQADVVAYLVSGRPPKRVLQADRTTNLPPWFKEVAGIALTGNVELAHARSGRRACEEGWFDSPKAKPMTDEQTERWLERFKTLGTREDPEAAHYLAALIRTGFRPPRPEFFEPCIRIGPGDGES